MASSSSPRWKCHIISLDEIKDATDNFNERNFLGHGGEGDVYLAEIRLDLKRTQVAVKHLNPKYTKEFEKEIKTVSKIQHPNLVSLLGYCDESGKKILVYEFMEKGSLSSYVKGESSISLSWQQRLRICIDAARGLQHLHGETDEFPKGIIHRDVKPDNILLDKNWVAKISDFGMLKLSHVGQMQSTMNTNLKGTGGYYAPEYITYRSITRKIDVYAFGVVLFQVLCLKMPWDRGDESYYCTDDEDLGIWAQQNVDAKIKEEICDDSLKAFTAIVGKSLKIDPRKRPTMDMVVLDLENALKCQKREGETKQLQAVKESHEQSTGLHPKAPSPRLLQKMTSEVKIYSFKEVSKHNKKKDCWIIISGKVYDVTPFMDDHPGGDEVMLLSTEKDATEDFEDVGHSENAIVIMKHFYVGDVDLSTIPPKKKYIPPSTSSSILPF